MKDLVVKDLEELFNTEFGIFNHLLLNAKALSSRCIHL